MPRLALRRRKIGYVIPEPYKYSKGMREAAREAQRQFQGMSFRQGVTYVRRLIEIRNEGYELEEHDQEIIEKLSP